MRGTDRSDRDDRSRGKGIGPLSKKTLTLHTADDLLANNKPEKSDYT